MYVSKCPKCGSSDIDSYGQWDIVTDQSCEACGWEKCYGSVVGFPGSHYLEPFFGGLDLGLDSDYDDLDLEDDSNIEKSTPSYPTFATYKDFEESDDLPF